VLFGITYTVDRAAYEGWIRFPSWVLNGSADSARVVVGQVAARSSNVVGIVSDSPSVALTTGLRVRAADAAQLRARSAEINFVGNICRVCCYAMVAWFRSAADRPVTSFRI